MAIEKINIENFLKLAEQHKVLDVRSPGEFSHAQIPGAHSLPLFTDEERKVVGTAYKQQSRQEAIKIGLDFFGVKMKPMVEAAQQLNSKTVLVHCWRGGMRSGAVAWLLDMYGFKVYTLAGGYKAFRNWVLKQFDIEYNLKILGGYTGSGKTIVLQELKKKNYQVIDLENLANHKGSAFGAIGEKPQPSQEMFENLLAIELFKKSSASTETWLEDESQRIGRLLIPNSFWEKMRNSSVYFLDIPFEERLNYLVTTYGSFEKDQLIESIGRIQKRLGGLEAKTAINFISEGNTRECFSILLKYYDKLYQKGLHNRKNYDSLLNIIPCSGVNSSVNVNKLSLQEV
ncbi:MAG TPA: tRNA 2-selenouridine(34) synthase MnmH [Chitinophagaceae bacterium]|nr:tRNA 2-selenouridine(34) synthase MnmH [Chitinophagaceae bacterium]